MKIRCKCCQKQIIKIANTKLCGNCSSYTITLRHEIGNLKYKLRKLKLELYGIDDKRMIKLIKK